MRLTSRSLHEEARLADLYFYNILDHHEEKDFDDLTDLVAQIYGCPSAAITFVDKDRMVFKASIGVNRAEIPRDKSVCTHTIMDEKIMVVQDLQKDDRFSANALLTEELNIRFYAGAPIVSEAGYNLGAVCIFDEKPRKLSVQQCIGLKAVATQVSKLLQLKAKNKLLQQQAFALLQIEKQLTQTIRQEHEKERLNIGIELHENIAQGLAATKLYLDLMGKTIDHPFLQKSTDTVTQLLQQVKDLTHTIVPTTLQGSGLKNLLQILVSRYQHQYGLVVDFTFKGTDVLKPDLSMSIFRMVEEAFENVRLHAKANAIVLDVKTSNKAIAVSIRDNGCGLNLEHFKKGTGLTSIVSMIEYFGGTVDITSDNRNGCALLLQLPLQKQINHLVSPIEQAASLSANGSVE